MARPKKWGAMDNIITVKIKMPKTIREALQNKLKQEDESMQSFFINAVFDKLKQ